MKAEELKEKGNQLFKTGEYETAIRYYSDAIKLDQNNSIYYSNRARCYKHLEKYEEQLADGQHAVELDPNNLKAHFLIGEALCNIGKTNKDLARIDTALTRMSKALGMCSSQDARALEFDITVAIRKAKKLKWMMRVRDMEARRHQIMKQVEEQLNKAKDQREVKRHLENLKSIVLGGTSQKKSDIPDYFICPLTQTLMVDPVINEFGHTYEKKQYIAYAAAKAKDPISGSPLMKNIMYDNIAIKNAIEYYLQDNIWAFDFREGQTIDSIHF